MYKKYSLFLFVCLLLMVSCDTPRQYHPQTTQRVMTEHERIVIRYGNAFEQLAPEFTSKVSQVISPQSGRRHVATAYYQNRSDVKWDYQRGYVACRIRLQWEACDWPSVPYGLCQLEGWMYYYPEDLGNEHPHVDFYYDRRNDHVVRVSKPKHWEVLKRGIRL